MDERSDMKIQCKNEYTIAATPGDGRDNPEDELQN